MAVFVPFRAYRPKNEFVKEVTCKPYDVLNAEEAREEGKGKANSFYHVTKPEINFPAGQDPFAPEVYISGKEKLESLIENEILIQDKKPSFYVYQIQMGNHTQTGLVGCCSIDDYFNNVIKKHELTKPKIEASRMKHITTSKFTYEPVFFSYPQNDSIDRIVNLAIQKEPLFSFTSTDRNQHTLWIIEEQSTIEDVSRLFQTEVPKIYIADGHHRTAAGALAGKSLRNQVNGYNGHHYNDLMCVLFPHDQVKIMEYNRVVKDLNGYSEEEFLALLHTRFYVEEKDKQYAPEEQHLMSMYMAGKWYRLEAREGRFDPDDLVDHLSFTILSKQILEPILNIVDLRRDSRIGFVGGIRGLDELEQRVDSGEMKVAFAMTPITMKQLMSIADQDLLLPPKVTWFEPKLRSGMFVHGLQGHKKLVPSTI